MAGAGKQRTQDELKNKAMLVVRNITKQEVTNVIFPNGITVGAKGNSFKNGFRVHGNAQISGIVNAQGFKVNGQDLDASGEFLFVDVDLPAVNISGVPFPNLLQVQITQNGQSETITSSDVTAFKNGDSPGPLTTLVITETTGPGTSFSTGSFDISTLRSASDYPITIRVNKGDRSSVKKVHAVSNGTNGADGSDGTDGTDGSDGATTILYQSTYDFTGISSGVNPNSAQLPNHGLSVTDTGFIMPDSTFGISHGQSIEDVAGVSVTSAVTPSDVLDNIYWIPKLSSSTGQITSITGIVQGTSVGISGVGTVFYLQLYETDDSLANGPTRFTRVASIAMGGSSTQTLAGSYTHTVADTTGYTIKQGYGYVMGIYVVTSNGATSGSLRFNFQIAYTGM